MLKPEELLRISEGAEEISEALHNEIVKRIIERMMLRIGRGEDYLLTSQDKWQIETLQQAGFLLEDIKKEIAQKTKLQQKEIAEAMENAGVKTLEYDEKLYKQVGIENKDLNKSPELLRFVQRNYEATMGEFKNFTGTMAEQTQQLFVKECDRAYALVSTGAMSYTEAVKEVVENIVSEGVQVHYPTGHKDTIETATMRAVRTGVSQMSAQIQIKRMEENEVEKVIISSHLGARPSHNVWQGKVFDLKELKSTDTGMPAYGTVTGLCGANCRHSFSPYFDFMDNPFKDYDSEENKKQYEKEQRQRTLERRIRKTKRETMGIKNAVDNCKDKKTKFELDLQYQKKAALLAKQNEEYKKYCENNKLKPLAERIRIANWNREQAAAARGAAKRYENAKTTYYGGIPKKWKNIDISKDDAVLNANINRGKAGYNMNCPNCACAYEMRKRGYDVVAKPYVKGGSHYLNKNPWKAWDGTEPYTVKTEQELHEYVEKYADGSRFGIALEYKDNTGHVIVGEKTNNILELFDVQIGRNIKNIDFEDLEGVKLWYTNEAKLSDRGVTACEGR